MLSFIEFWDTVDQAIGSSDHVASMLSITLPVMFNVDEDEVRCLKVLREKLLREYRLNPTSGRYVSNERLLKILRDVRESATDKRTWDDAIRSAESSTSAQKEHSLDTLAAAVKLMVDEYLWEAENGTPVQNGSTPIGPPRIEPPELFTDPLEDQLRSEIDILRSKLTESECACSELMESEKKLNREMSSLREDMERLTKKQQTSVHSPDLSLKLKEAEENLRASKLEIEKIKTDNTSLQSQYESIRLQLKTIQEIKISPNVSSESLPTLTEWRVIHKKLAYLLSTVTGSESTSSQLSLIESLMSQVQTLETQKSDAESEISRLSKLLISSQLTPKLPLPSLSSRKQAEEFVGSATASSVSSRKSTTLKKKKSKPFSDKNEYSVNNCVQQ